MATAYVLISCDTGSEKAVINELKSLEYVKEVQGTFGAYDIVIKVECPSADRLREIIAWKVRKIQHIRSTITLMGIEGQA